MDNAVNIDASDTLRPPPPAMPRTKKGKPGKRPPPGRKFAVIVPCEDEHQQTMLLEWLVGNGFDAEARSQ